MQKENHYRSRPRILWFTGLSGAGKSTLAHAVQVCLQAAGQPCFVLDDDALRSGLCRDLGFDAAARAENLRRAGHVAQLMAEAGMIVLCTFISPLAGERTRIRRLFAPGEFVELYCRCPLEECERRDVKGLYRRARAGQIGGFAGISLPYEAPRQAELVLDTATLTVEQAVAQIMALCHPAGGA
jgi:adenylylsulfate kinase